MMRVRWPVWALCCTLAVTGALTFNLGVLFGSTIPDERTKAKLTAVQAMIDARHMIHDHQGPIPAQQPPHFSVPRALSSEGDTLGFTVRPLDAPTYLLLSDDQAVLMLLRQEPDGTNKQCQVHPVDVQAGLCQPGHLPSPLVVPRGANQPRS